MAWPARKPWQVAMLVVSTDLISRPQYQYLRGWALNVLPDYNAEAEQLLSQAVKVEPNLVGAWNCLGECYWRAGKVHQAHHCFTGALKHVSKCVGRWREDIFILGTALLCQQFKIIFHLALTCCTSVSMLLALNIFDSCRKRIRSHYAAYPWSFGKRQRVSKFLITVRKKVGHFDEKEFPLSLYGLLVGVESLSQMQVKRKAMSKRVWSKQRKQCHLISRMAHHGVSQWLMTKSR